jgi:hypothetical protein
VFSEAAYKSAPLARLLNALYALEACVSADTLNRAPPCRLATESAPFARPQGTSLYEADALTWRFYYTDANCVVSAINNAAYGPVLARALHAGFFGSSSFIEDRKKNETITTTTAGAVVCLLAPQRQLSGSLARHGRH